MSAHFEVPENKIKVTAALTTRQINCLNDLAKRNGIRWTEAMSRVLDGWIEGNWLPSPISPKD